MSQTMSQPNEYDSIDELDELDELDFNNRKKAEEEENKKTCLQLQNLFHTAMLMGILPYLKTKEKMMDYLNTRGNPDWDYTYIWSLANTNKLDWVKGYDDPTPYEKYKEEMNYALGKILQPSFVH